MTYRKVFLGDASDIFEKRKQVEEKTGAKVAVTVGPTPFTGMSNAAAIAMASAMNRQQQPTRECKYHSAVLKQLSSKSCCDFSSATPRSWRVWRSAADASNRPVWKLDWFQHWRRSDRRRGTVRKWQHFDCFWNLRSECSGNCDTSELVVRKASRYACVSLLEYYLCGIG